MDLRAVDIGGGSAPKIEAGNGITKSGTGTAGDPMILSVSDPLEGTFVPRHDTAENLATVLLEDGEIATTTDTGEIRVGDGVTPGGLGYIDPEKYQKVVGRGDYISTAIVSAGSHSKNNIVYGGGLFVGAYVAGTTSASCYSYDGMVWTLGSTFPGSAVASVAYGNGIFILALQSALRVSRDGLDWSSSPLATASPFIAFGPGFFVVLDSTKTKLLLTRDGMSVFKTVDLSTHATFLGKSLRMVYSGGCFILFAPADTTEPLAKRRFSHLRGSYCWLKQQNVR